MKKMNNKRGFTLAELLIVVAIIAVLVAVSIPIFTSKLESSREAVDASNQRAAYALASADLLTGSYKDATAYTESSGAYTGYYDSASGKMVKDSASATTGKAQLADTQGPTPELPTGCTWSGGSNTAKHIKVVLTPASNTVAVTWD